MTAERDARWYREVYDAHADEVLAYLWRRTSRGTATDLLSEVFVVVWTRRATVPAAGQRRAWMFRVARNVLRNHLRGEARRGRLLGRLARQRPLPVGHAEAVIADVGLRDAMARLRPADREVLRLHAWEDCTTAELAAVLGCSANAARIRLHRARRRLRALLDADAATAHLAGGGASTGAPGPTTEER